MSQNSFTNDHVYTQHLAEVNENNSVVSSEDIVNDKGAILIPKGQSISKEKLNRVSQHKLKKPIDQSVKIENTLSSREVFTDLMSIPSHPEILEILNNKMSTVLFSKELQLLDSYSLLIQKLTVLKHQYPFIYQKTLLSSFIAWLIALERKLTEPVRNVVILSSLAKDNGLLHIDPAVVNKKGALSEQEWNLLKGHVVISYQLTRIGGQQKKDVSLAVLQHHERTDGLGYPRQTLEYQLCEEGQILAFSDMLVALFYKHIFTSAYPLESLIPIIQVNASIHKYENSHAAIRLIKRYASPYTPRYTHEKSKALIERLQSAHPLFNLLYRQLQEINQFISKNAAEEDISSSSTCIQSIESLMNTSGLSHDSILYWLKSLNESSIANDELIELERYSMMISEGIWRLNELIRLYRNIASNQPQESASKFNIEKYLISSEETFSKLKNVMSN